VGNPILGVDFGKVRIGLAIGDTDLRSSMPLRVILRTNEKSDMEAVASAIREYGGNEIVLGLPLNMNGTEGPSADEARRFAEALRTKGITVHMEDERLTTFEVLEDMRQAGISQKKQRERLDMFAAAAILRSYFLKISR